MSEDQGDQSPTTRWEVHFQYGIGNAEACNSGDAFLSVIAHDDLSARQAAIEQLSHMAERDQWVYWSILQTIPVGIFLRKILWSEDLKRYTRREDRHE